VLVHALWQDNHYLRLAFAPFFMTLMFGVTEAGFVDACGMALMLFSLQLMALLKRRLASAGESLFVSTKSDTKNDPDKPSKAR